MWELLDKAIPWVAGGVFVYWLIGFIYYEIRGRMNSFIAADNFDKTGRVDEVRKTERQV